MKIKPIILEGNIVRLEHLSSEHKEGLCEAIFDGQLWKLHVTLVPHPDNIDEFLINAHDAFEAGDGLAFSTIDKEGLGKSMWAIRRM